MSASLVGSEMCIRDRCARITDCRRVRRWTGSPDCGVLSRTREGFVAVSYTHLTLPTICSV
eukprot:4605812-Alexandrium_andersonii.AAC.1